MTAEYGIRFKAEQPNFPLGKNDDMSFHVPLLVYLPNILNRNFRPSSQPPCSLHPSWGANTLFFAT